jgi:hypothetical protein
MSPAEGEAGVRPDRIERPHVSGLYLHAGEEHGNVTLSEVLQAAQK